MSSLKARKSTRIEESANNPPLGPAIVGLPEVAIGRVFGFDVSGSPLIVVAAMAPTTPIPAQTLHACSAADIGQRVVIVFADGDRSRPIVIGKLPAGMADAQNALSAAPEIDVRLNGRRLDLEAADEIVLKCGKASLTLTRAGKILIRGNYLLSRSSGVNRIKGGSVQIN